MPVTKPKRRSRVFATSLAALVVSLGVFLAYRGWSFYTLGLHERPDHPDFKLLRPSGLIGNGYGFAAAVLIVTNLLYLARRRIPRFRLGSMRFWLDLHVFTGLTAAMLVGFHSAFQLRSPLATLTAASLGIVVLTGIIGRLFYALVPEDGAQELAAAVAAVGAEAPRIHAEIELILHALPAPRLAANASLVRCLAVLPRWRRTGIQRRVAIRGAFKPFLRAAPDRQERRKLRSLRRWVIRASVGEVRSAAGAALLRSWRSLHRLFAITMLVAVGVHVGVAWHFGYRWIFQ
jgi:GNAT superfamily N-acetyltransferase